MPSIHSGEWDPLFAACVEHRHRAVLPPRVVVAQHDGVDRRARRRRHVGVVGRHDLHARSTWCGPRSGSASPTLKFSLTEGDIGWIPYFLWRSEHVNDRHHGWINHDFSKTGGPTQIFRDHILVLLHQGDGRASSCCDHFNIDNVCWESDYPHSDGTWPNAPEELLKTLDGPRATSTINKISPRERDAPLPVRPVRAPAQGAVHRRRPCGPSRPTSTSSPASVDRPTSATSRAGSRSPPPAARPGVPRRRSPVVRRRVRRAPPT